MGCMKSWQEQLEEDNKRLRDIVGDLTEKQAKLIAKEKHNVRPRGTDNASVIQVIQTKSMRGIGTQEDKVRIVTQYWSLDGKLLAENDPCDFDIEFREVCPNEAF